MNMLKILKMMLVLEFHKSIGIFTSEHVMTLDWVDGVSIRETDELKKEI